MHSPPITTGDLAARLNVSRDTIRNYARDFAEFLSTEATGVQPNAKRRYTHQDCLTLATIAQLRDQGLRLDQIKEALKAGRLVEQLPALPDPAEQEVRQAAPLVLRAEYERSLDRIKALTDEVDVLRAERDRAISTWQADTTQLNAKISQLEREIGQLEGRMESRRPDRWWVIAVALVALLVAAGTVYVVVLALSIKR